MSFVITPTHKPNVPISGRHEGFFSKRNPLKQEKKQDSFERRAASRQALTVRSRATTQEIFETISHPSERREGNPYNLKNYSLKHVLFHKPSGQYFKIDRSKYPYVVTNEEVAKNVSKQKNVRQHRDSSRVIFVDGRHQILQAFGPPMEKNAPAWVIVNGPILWPLDFEEKQNTFTLAEEPILAQAKEIEGFVQREGLNPPPTQKTMPWQDMIRKLHEETAARFTNSVSNQPKKEMGDLYIRFTSLLPDGYTEDLELVPSEDLPKLWAQKRLKLEE